MSFAFLNVGVFKYLKIVFIQIQYNGWLIMACNLTDLPVFEEERNRTGAATNE